MSLGPAEILVLLVVVVVFVGPRRLPEAARRRGPAWRDGRRDFNAWVADPTDVTAPAPRRSGVSAATEGSA